MCSHQSEYKLIRSIERTRVRTHYSEKPFYNKKPLKSTLTGENSVNKNKSENSIK